MVPDFSACLHCKDATLLAAGCYITKDQFYKIHGFEPNKKFCFDAFTEIISPDEIKAALLRIGQLPGCAKNSVIFVTMHISPHIIIILLSCVIILSYLFNLISRNTRIPSVLLLIITGIAIKYLSGYYGYVEQDVAKLVKVLGTTGLIMIVLEAALDIVLSRSKLRVIRDSVLSATIAFIVSAFSIAYLLSHWLNQPFHIALLYAIPMSIISSAIVIPSTSHLPEMKKEFIVYESSFSDIL